MIDRLKFRLNRLLERLWVKPLLMCLLSLLGAFLAKAFEYTPLAAHVPKVSLDSVETLLRILAGSMLVIATFAVGSMVASYASASNAATPRSFPLVVSDDVSQNALSIFVGAFIYSLVSIVFLQNDFYEEPGRSALLLLTMLAFGGVILTFVRWVDRIARLGRLGATIDTVEAATHRALQRRRLWPAAGGQPVTASSPAPPRGHPVRSSTVGYVQRVEVDQLQRVAEQAGARIHVRAVPGTFAAPDRVLAEIILDAANAANAADEADEADAEVTTQAREMKDPDLASVASSIQRAFRVGDARTFDEDPRFGLIALSEIADRALSPGVNDPGTAIDIIGTIVRLLAGWAEPVDPEHRGAPTFDRILFPELSPEDMLDDAFIAIARDGAGCIEVATRLQKALRSLSILDAPSLRAAATRHAREALQRAEAAMTHPPDLERLRAVAAPLVGAAAEG